MMTGQEFFEARERQLPIEVLPSAEGCDLNAAYAVEREVRKLREAAGHRVVGRKVGYANKAMWRILKLETLVWAAMYEDTIYKAPEGHLEFSLAKYRSPRIEPEIVIQVGEGGKLESVAFGFEILDNPFPDWKFQPADFVAAWGLHAASIIGPPLTITDENREQLSAQLADFKLVLMRGDEQIEEGAGKNSLRSPAQCVVELARAAEARGDTLRAGELVSTGTLTNAQPIAPGEEWRVELNGLPVQNLRVQFT
jgi:2-oxo-3-hexenedioate decarboxylase